jgi:peptidoglycan/xylan/chitin deacetylase (PgdA/CDA1 family)
MNAPGKVLYLTFDDGPHPVETPYVLDQLEQYDAKASFFCIGKNVELHPGLYQEVIDKGHSVGNHGYAHIDGWKTSNKKYFSDVAQAAQIIKTPLFRPPFGHITWNQVNHLKKEGFGLRTILWNVLSADFDENTPVEKCLYNVTSNAQPGSIVLFHDSDAASRNMRYALPRVLEHFSEQGYRFEGIRL